MANISMKEIAKLSGVSVATVSRVINNNGRFSEETRKRVLSIIEETGYNANSVAKSLRMQKSNTIGIVVPDITNFFFADIVQKIEEQFFTNNYSTIICNTGRSNEKEQLYLRMLQSKMIDGLIVISGVEEFDLMGALTEIIPVICIDRKPKNSDQTLFISSDHYTGAKEATKLLISKGAKHPVILMYNRSSSSAEERLNGFKDALKENGIQFDTSKHTIKIKANNRNNSREETLNAIKYFVSTNKTIDAVFSVNDHLALYAIEVFEHLNYNIPKEIKIVGFDDTPLAIQSRPQLSTVRQDTAQLANLTCSNLLKLIESNHSSPKDSLLVPVQLIERETT